MRKLILAAPMIATVFGCAGAASEPMVDATQLERAYWRSGFCARLAALAADATKGRSSSTMLDDLSDIYTEAALDLGASATTPAVLAGVEAAEAVFETRDIAIVGPPLRECIDMATAP